MQAPICLIFFSRYATSIFTFNKQKKNSSENADLCQTCKQTQSMEQTGIGTTKIEPVVTHIHVTIVWQDLSDICALDFAYYCWQMDGRTDRLSRLHNLQLAMIYVLWSSLVNDLSMFHDKWVLITAYVWHALESAHSEIIAL